ncbi:hypothetical protein D3C71_1568070 [compost metagenome]
MIKAEQFGGQIVALEGHLTVCLQQRQPLGGCHGAALVQLIQFEQEAGIIRLEGEGATQALLGRRQIAALVEVIDAKVAPGRGKPGRLLAHLLPQGDGLRVAALAVVEAAQQIAGKPAVGQLCQHGHLPQGIGEAHLAAKGLLGPLQQGILRLTFRQQTGLEQQRQGLFHRQQREQLLRQLGATQRQQVTCEETEVHPAPVAQGAQRLEIRLLFAHQPAQ